MDDRHRTFEDAIEDFQLSVALLLHLAGGCICFLKMKIFVIVCQTIHLLLPVYSIIHN